MAYRMIESIQSIYLSCKVLLNKFPFNIFKVIIRNNYDFLNILYNKM